MLLLFFLFETIKQIPKEASNHTKSELNKEIVPWGHDYIGIDKEIKNFKVKVAILDSGINSNHVDLKNKVAKSYNVIQNTNYIVDDFGHGTNIAGIITANHNSYGIIGVSQNVQIYDIKVLNAEGKGEIDDVLTGLLWAYENDVDIINISFGFSKHYSELQEMIDLLVSEGIIIVAASGNNLGQEADYPARYRNVISVGSIDKDGNVDILGAQGKIDVFAPGKDIFTTSMSGGYEKVRGTSFSTAYITGALVNGLSNGDINTSFDDDIFEQSMQYLRRIGLIKDK